MPPPWILLGVDFSDFSRVAFDHAVSLALKVSADLLVFHAWNPTGWPSEAEMSEAGEEWLEAAQDSARVQLDKWGQRARRAGVVGVETQMEAGPASRLLPEVARSRGPALLVIGRRGRARLAHVLLGSVSERVVRLAPCPVLVVPGVATRAAPPERLLVGVDFSSASQHALDAAVRFSRDLAAHRGLIAVHAYPGERELWLQNWSELARRAKWPYDREALERWAAPRLATGVTLDARVVDGRTETVLLEVARDTQCDWIVLGVQGRTALASLLIGSTTDRVLKLTDRPVLAVPSGATAGVES